MSLQKLIERQKKLLKPCRTVITDVSGKVYEITNSERVEIGRRLSFVVDTKPDLQVGCVIPGLYLGSQDIACSVTLLKQYEIKHILSVGIDLAVKFDDINYHKCDLLDLPESDISSMITLCAKIIHRNRRDNILVHCNAGVSRAPTIVIAYLILFENKTYEEAFKIVKYARPYIKPNEGFIKQLKTLSVP